MYLRLHSFSSWRMLLRRLSIPGFLGLFLDRNMLLMVSHAIYSTYIHHYSSEHTHNHGASRVDEGIGRTINNSSTSSWHILQAEHKKLTLWHDFTNTCPHILHMLLTKECSFSKILVSHRRHLPRLSGCFFSTKRYWMYNMNQTSVTKSGGSTRCERIYEFLLLNIWTVCSWVIHCRRAQTELLSQQTEEMEERLK